MQKNFFDDYPEFIDNDIRKDRPTSTVTSESLSNRLNSLLPSWLIKDKTVLDLGSCFGSAGHWALSKGAKHYTGVEIQKTFCDKSNEMLSKYWTNFDIINSEIYEFNPDQKYDIVLAAGVVHCYFDPFKIYEKICSLSNEYVIIETLNPPTGKLPSIYLFENNMVGSEITKPYRGMMSWVDANAIDIIMSENEFSMYGERVYPKRINNTYDSYNDKTKIFGMSENDHELRIMLRYKKKHQSYKNSLEYKILNDKPIHKPVERQADGVTQVKQSTWSFDTEVANRFQEEAKNNIPDYERVIQLCIDICKKKCNEQDLVVDVGSALGYTLRKFVDSGHKAVIGIESSEHMLYSEHQLHRERTILSETFRKDLEPKMVLANWTLHFILEREEYIKDVFDSLPNGGVFVLTDKTPQSETIKEMYYDFKRKNGVSEKYIKQKEEKLKGYMYLYPIDWYQMTLERCGFKNIQIINSNLGFVTFYAEK